MLGSSYLSQPTIVRLPVLLRQIAAGEYRIPRFQRPFVWNDDKRLLLLDSIKQGLPIGSILVWTTAQHRLEEYERLGPFRLPAPSTASTWNYVIDGHQRMVTIYSALVEPDSTVATPDEDDGVRWPLYYDLEKEDFCLAPRRRRPKDEWLPLPRMLDPDALYEFQKGLLAKGLKQLSARAENLASRFKDYQVPLVPLFTENIGLVTECFRRVNSAGASMSEFHMLSAVTWSEEFDLRRHFQEIKEGLAPLGWADLDEQVLVDVLKVVSGLDYYHATPDELHTKLKEDPSLLQRLPEHVHHAVEFLGSRCNVFGPAALPYQLQLVLLCEAAHRLGGAIDGTVGDELERWFWRTSFSESFTGISNRDVWLAVNCIWSAVVGGPAAGDFWEYPSAIMPFDRFRANAVRSRTLALLLARCNPLDASGGPFEAARMLADLGADAVPKIIPASDLRSGSDGPENRWVVHPRHLKAMRDLLGPGLDPRRDEILASHFILQDARAHYLRRDFQAFLEARRREIIAMERDFVEDLGLSYAERYETIPQG